MLSPCDSVELVRCIGPSIMELPRWLASHSSLNLPWLFCAADSDSGDEAEGLPGVEPKSCAAVDSDKFAFGVLPGPYPLSSCACEGGGRVAVALRDAMVVTDVR